MAAEIKTLLWLQGRLLLGVFRSRRADTLARVGRLLLALLLLVSTLPLFAVAAVGIAILLALMSPAAGLELVVLVNTGIFLLWLLMPSMYNTDLLERLDLHRLFAYPVSGRGMVAGSVLTSALSPLGFGATMVLCGEVVGLVWQRPLALPLILAGAAISGVVMGLGGRLMEDIFELVEGDRTLRGLLMGLLMLPWLVFMFGTYYVQYMLAQAPSESAWLKAFFAGAPAFKGLNPAQGLEAILLWVHPSRVLGLLPTGWGGEAMVLPVAGDLARGLLFLCLGLMFCAGLVWLHGAILRRMMQGVALHLGTSRVKVGRLGFELPGPPALWTLVAKDWLAVKRSPMMKQILIGSPLLTVIFGFSVWQITHYLPPASAVRLELPFVASGVMLVAVNLAMINLTCNYFGAIDREGFSALMLAPVDSRFVLISQGMVTLAYTMIQCLVLLVVVALLTGLWTVIPWGLAVALLLTISTQPAYALVGIVSPYRAQLTMSSKNQGNFWMVLAWMIASVPALALGMVPLFTWVPALAITLPLAALYAGGLYAITLGPLSRLMVSRSWRIHEVVSKES